MVTPEKSRFLMTPEQHLEAAARLKGYGTEQALMLAQQHENLAKLIQARQGESPQEPQPPSGQPPRSPTPAAWIKRLHLAAVITLIAMIVIACLIVLGALPHWAYELTMAVGILTFFAWHSWKGREGASAYIMAALSGMSSAYGSIELGLWSEAIIGWGLTAGLLLAGFAADHQPTRR
jgi:hypothetical protein